MDSFPLLLDRLGPSLPAIHPRELERARLTTMALACTAASSRLIHHPYCSMVLSSNKNHPRTPPPFISIHRPLAGAALTTSSSSSALHSVDVSKDDKPLETPPQQSTQQEEEEQPKLDPRRFEEKFAVLNTGIHDCRSCGYRYDQAAGDPSYPVPPGLPFARLPDDWRCPTCGAAQSFFESKSVEIAGFAQNQQFGLGGNSLTSGQKGLLIYGGLLVGFLFFISGYFLQ